MRRDEPIAHLLNAWLEAEAAAADEASEVALGALLARLPEVSPGGDFADRVLAGAGIRPRGAAHRWRWALAAALLLVPASLVAALATQLASLAGHFIGPADPVVLLGRAALTLGQWIGAVAGLWGRFAELGRFSRVLLEAPQTQAVLALCAALALSSYAVLHSLLSAPARSARHVES